MIPKFRAWYMPFGPKGPMQEMVHEKASSILVFAEMSPDKYIVEQFTGLKDRNGKDVYEGDIVKYTAEDGDSFLAPVKYFAADGYPAFDIPTAFIPYWHFESNVLSAGMAENSIEVVGNIHDSPELLEAQHDTQPD